MTISNPINERMTDTGDDASHNCDFSTNATIHSILPTEEQSRATWRKIEESERAHVQ